MSLENPFSKMFDIGGAAEDMFKGILSNRRMMPSGWRKKMREAAGTADIDDNRDDPMTERELDEVGMEALVQAAQEHPSLPEHRAGRIRSRAGDIGVIEFSPEHADEFTEWMRETGMDDQLTLIADTDTQMMALTAKEILNPNPDPTVARTQIQNAGLMALKHGRPDISPIDPSLERDSSGHDMDDRSPAGIDQPPMSLPDIDAPPAQSPDAPNPERRRGSTSDDSHSYSW